MNPKHQIFLSEVLRHGDANRAYKAAYPDASGESLRVAANRLLHNPGIQKCINEFHGSIRDYLAQEVIARREDQLHTVRKKRAVLKTIYTKEMETIKTITSKVYEVRDIIIEPTNAEILKAIQLDNTLAEKEEELMGYEIPGVIQFGHVTEEPEKSSENVTNRNIAARRAGSEVMISIDVPDIEEDFDAAQFFKETDESAISDLVIDPATVTIEDEPETTEIVTDSNNPDQPGKSINPDNPGSNKQHKFLNRLKHKQKEKLMVA